MSTKTSQNEYRLKRRRLRLVVLLLAIAVSSVFFQFVIEAPIRLPDSFLALPFMSLWQPLFGLPLILFSIWWVLDRRVPLFVLIIPLFLVAYCGRLLIGSPPGQSEEELQVLKEAIGEEALEDHTRSKSPGYQRKWFPPF